MSPTILGLLLAIQISWASGQLSIGLWLKRRGILLTPEESSPPAIAEAANARILSLARRGLDEGSALDLIHADPALRERHIAMLPVAARRERGQFSAERALAEAKLGEAQSLEEAAKWLQPKEKAGVLTDGRSWRSLRACREAPCHDRLIAAFQQGEDHGTFRFRQEGRREDLRSQRGAGRAGRGAEEGGREARSRHLGRRRRGAGRQGGAHGSAMSMEEAEKIILAIGNTMGVSQVESKLAVHDAVPPSKMVTVKKGDTLWKIAEEAYGKGKGGQYDKIFQANRPMLSHPDKIYPGQVLRIPPL